MSHYPGAAPRGGAAPLIPGLESHQPCQVMSQRSQISGGFPNFHDSLAVRAALFSSFAATWLVMMARRNTYSRSVLGGEKGCAQSAMRSCIPVQEKERSGVV
jgi:hypothetical protein